jgi:hypothetical protein
VRFDPVPRTLEERREVCNKKARRWPSAAHGNGAKLQWQEHALTSFHYGNKRRMALNTNDSNALWHAVAKGDVGTVQAWLLLDPDVVTEHSAALRCAAWHGFADVVHALLADGRADPSADHSTALCAAVDRGHVAVVQSLLADGRADPAAMDSLVLRSAAFAPHVDILRVLLKDGRADPGVSGSAALIGAVIRGHAEAVFALLEDGRADPAAYDSDVLVNVASHGHVGILHALLEDGRADPCLVSDRPEKATALAARACRARPSSVGWVTAGNAVLAAAHSAPPLPLPPDRAYCIRMLRAARLAAFVTCVAAECIITTASIDALPCNPTLCSFVHCAGSTLIIMSVVLAKGAGLWGQVLAEQCAVLAAASAIPAVLTLEGAASLKVLVVRHLVCVHFAAATCYVLTFARLQFPGTQAYAAGGLATLALALGAYVAARLGNEAADWC